MVQWSRKGKGVIVPNRWWAIVLIGPRSRESRANQQINQYQSVIERGIRNERP